MAKKRKTKAYLPVYLSALALVVISSVTVYLIYRVKNSSPKSQSLVVREENKIQQNITNGVYENYIYGFKFSYPNEIFTYPKYDNKDNHARIYETFVQPIPGDKIGEGMALYVVVGGTEYSLRLYETDKDRKIGELFYPEETYKTKPLGDWPGDNNVKTEILRGDGYEGYIVYTFMTGGGGGQEAAYGYHATIRKDNFIITIGILNSDDERKVEQYKLLKSILSSIKFTES